MTTFLELLTKHGEAIVQRWLDAALATYPQDSGALFKREKDRFANPVGHGLRVATQGVFEVLLDGGDDGVDTEKIREPLREIVKMRAVQEFSASQAVGFVFDLKEAVRAELGEATGDPRIASGLVKFEAEIDRVALAGFDLFVECREQVSELRINEVKRRVSWIVDKMNERGSDSELAEADSG